MKTSVYFSLLAEFGTGMIPLEAMSKKYFGLEPDTAKIRAGRGELPVQPVRLDGQKSPWLVPADKLAALIEQKMEQAA